MEPILLFTGASENTLNMAVDYLPSIIRTVFVEISTGLNSFINAQGRPAIANVLRLDRCLIEYYS